MIKLTKLSLKKDLSKIYLEEEYSGHLTAYGNKTITKKTQEETKYA